MSIASNSHKITLVCTAGSSEGKYTLKSHLSVSKSRLCNEECILMLVKQLYCDFLSAVLERTLCLHRTHELHRRTILHLEEHLAMKTMETRSGNWVCESLKSKSWKGVLTLFSKIPVYLKDIKIHNKTSFFNRHFCCT